MDDKKLSALFNKFVGKEVPMVEKTTTVKHRGQDHTYTELSFANENDPVIAEMEKTAKDNGLDLWLRLPNGGSGPMDVRDNRVGAHIEKARDGKYRISKFSRYIIS